MNLSSEQQQLIDEYFAKIKERFPEIVFKNLDISPDDPEHIWINVFVNMDEDREIELHSYSAEIAIDILLEHGYSLSIMPENQDKVYA